MARRDLEPLLPGDAAPAEGTAPLRQWQLLALLGALAAGAMLVGAGVVLSEAGLGRAAANRQCNGSLLAGLLLLALAGGMAGMARIVVDRRYVHELFFDTARLAAGLPVPLLGLAVSAPGFMGCSFAVRVADWPLLGDALLGTPGMAIAGACAFATGIALTSVVRVRVPLATLIEEYERLQHGDAPASLAERALAAHDLLDTGATLAGPLGGAMRLVDSSELLRDPGALPADDAADDERD